MDTDLDSYMGWDLLLPMFAAAILGGIGRPYGAIAGGMIIGLAEELSAYPWFGTEPLLAAELQDRRRLRHHGDHAYRPPQRDIPRTGF